MKSRLEVVARPFGDAGRQLATLLAEAEPFVECARVAAAEGPLERSPSWREARSMAYLLAYRLGDQEWPAHVAAAVIPAWRDAIGAAWATAAADELVALFLDGYARGREDRVRTAAQKNLADSLPVGELAPQVVLMIAAGALDADGARAFADRASAFMLRRDARAAMLDVEGLHAPSAAVLAELWSIPSAARMLGVKMVVAGLNGLVGEAVRSSGVKEEGEIRCATLAAGTEALLREAGIALGSRGGFGAWLRRVFSPRGAR